MLKEWFNKYQAKKKLETAFKLGGMSVSYEYGTNKGSIYPKIHSVSIKENTTSFIFTLPIGFDPKEIYKKEYCFKQVFGEKIQLKGDVKKIALTVYTTELPSVVRYDLEPYKHLIRSKRLPVICGIDKKGKHIVYDMIEFPHLLIGGETGSGKSTQLRSVLTALIASLSPKKLELYLCDLKRSEFHLFRKVEHVKHVAIKPSDMLPILLKLQSEMKKRGDLLDHHELSHIDDLPEEQPYIVLCIDEVALLKKEKAIMDIVEEISAIGRALGIFLILSMQRPDSKVMEGALKNNLTVRMGFKCSDSINARVLGTVGSEKLEGNGKFLLKLDGLDSLNELQAPYLTVIEAKTLLKPYKVNSVINNDSENANDDIFGVLDE